MTTKRVRQKIGLARIGEPDNVTLTEKPANRSGFKIMRSVGEEQEAGAPTERSDKYLIRIELPEGISEEDAISISDSYGLDEGYSLTSKDGRYTLVRSERSGNKGVSVAMNDGSVAYVDTKAFQRSEDILQSTANTEEEETPPRKSVRLVSLRFDAETFATPAAVDDWLTQRSIPYPANGVEQQDDGFIVTTSEADDETKDIAYGTGVTGVICRADEEGLPGALYAQTIEQAYGSWGWDQLNFAAAMADVVFTDSSYQYLDTLNEVLRNIIFYSSEDLDTRKKLIVNALSEYASFMVGLIDALPQSVIEQTRSDTQPSEQESEMGTKATTASTEAATARTEQDATTEAPATEAPATEQNTSEFITRADMESAVTAAVTAAFAAAAPVAKETEAASTEAAAAPVTTERAEEPAAGSMASLEKAMESMVGIMGSMAESVKAIPTLTQRVDALRSELDEELGTTTVTRSTEETQPVSKKTERSEDDNPDAVFRGILGNRIAH